jgi:hypothetical protein
MPNGRRYCAASSRKRILDRGERDVACVRIVWRGGAVSEIAVKMRVGSVANLTRGAEMRERVIELARTKMHDDEIAAVLTSDKVLQAMAPIAVSKALTGRPSDSSTALIADHGAAHSPACRPQGPCRATDAVVACPRRAQRP